MIQEAGPRELHDELFQLAKEVKMSCYEHINIIYSQKITLDSTGITINPKKAHVYNNIKLFNR